MDYSVKDFYVPTIAYFTSGNKLTGSRTGMNYKMTPIEDKEILVQVWYGPMNLEHSELVCEQNFAMEKESMGQIESWLYGQYDVYLKTPQAKDYRKKEKQKNA